MTDDIRAERIQHEAPERAVVGAVDDMLHRRPRRAECIGEAHIIVIERPHRTDDRHQERPRVVGRQFRIEDRFERRRKLR
jgi:hypothetical protein